MPNPSPYRGTQVESPDEIRQALEARLAALGGKIPPPKPPAPPGATQPVPEKPVPAGETPLCRPIERPPMALLCIVNDGDTDGEWISLRADRYIIGRTEGDVLIPHDGQISTRHAELSRVRTDEGIRWILSDLESRNGTFVRVGKVLLNDGHQLMFGWTRYRFDDAKGQVAPKASGSAPPVSTLLPGHSGIAGGEAPVLVEIAAGKDGARIPMIKSEYWVGRDPKICAIVPPGDVFVNPQHARFYRGSDSRWRLENNRSVNGVWLRIGQPLPLDGGCQFLVGEQRFILKVLS